MRCLGRKLLEDYAESVKKASCNLVKRKKVGINSILHVTVRVSLDVDSIPYPLRFCRTSRSLWPPSGERCPRCSTKECPYSPLRDLSDVRQRSVYLTRPENSEMFDESVSVQRSPRRSTKECLSIRSGELSSYVASVCNERLIKILFKLLLVNQLCCLKGSARNLRGVRQKRVPIYPVQRPPRRSTKECPYSPPRRGECASPSRDLSDVRRKCVPLAFREMSKMFDESVSYPLALREISAMFDERMSI